MDNMELNLNEMEEVVGGKNEGGYVKKPAAHAVRKIYRIASGDTLIKIAHRNNTTVDRIMTINPELKNKNYIVAGCYIYLPD